MLTYDYILGKRIKLQEIFRKNMNVLKDYISDEDFTEIENLYLDAAITTIHSFVSKDNVDNISGKSFCLYPVSASKIDNSNRACIFRVISKNEETGLIEVGDFSITTHDGWWNLDITEFNKKISDVLDNSRPCQLNEIPDYMKYTQSFKMLHAYDLVGHRVFSKIEELNQKYSIDETFTKNTHSKIKETIRLRDNEIDKNKIKAYDTEIRDLRKKLYRKPTNEISFFIKKKRSIGVKKQKVKSILMFYKQALDQEEKRILRSSLLFNPYHYNILKGYNYTYTDTNRNSKEELEQNSLYRKQALSRYPIMGKHLISSVEDVFSENKKGLKLIDIGESPENSFRKFFANITDDAKEFSKSFKKLEKLYWQKVGTPMFHDISNINKILPIINILPKEIIPSSRKGWILLQQMSHLFKEEDLKKMILGSFGRNKAYKSLDEYAKIESVSNHLDNLSDFLRSFEDRILQPHLILLEENQLEETAHKKLKYDSILTFLSTNSLSKLHKFAADWHTPSRISQLNNILQVGNVDISGEWTSITDGEFVSSHGLEVVSLNSTKKLIEEGNRMKHCVGSYARRCMLQNSNIVSIRNKDGEPQSTADLSFEPADKNETYHTGDEFKISMLQHKSLSNKTPSKECVETLQEFISALKDNIVVVNEEVVNKQNNKDHLLRRRSSYNRIGFDPHNKNGVGDMLLNYFSRYLRNDIKNLDYDNFSKIAQSYIHNKNIKNQIENIETVTATATFGGDL